MGRPRPPIRLALAILLAFAAVPAAADTRVALVIGNAAYADAPLKNPANDARAMAGALRGRGFDVILRVNARKPEMENAVADFGERLSEGATGLFGQVAEIGGRGVLELSWRSSFGRTGTVRAEAR